MDICLNDSVVSMKQTNLRPSASYVIRKFQVANSRCFALMQHAGMKSHKEKASVRLAFARKDSVLHKEKKLQNHHHLVLQSKVERKYNVLKHHRKVLRKCLSRTFS